MSIIVCKIPKAGLGNQLFPIMKALVKHKLTGIPLVITNYRQFLIGPYLRREKSKRRYNGYFNFEKNIIAAWLDTLKLNFYQGYKVINEPSLKDDNVAATEKCLYFYKEPSHWSDYFFELRDYRDIVLSSFYELLRPQVLALANKKPAPCIGVHIRMGDFRKLKAGEDFSKSGTVRTPEKYFIETIKSIRKIAGKDLPATIFTDGYRHEFEELFDLPFITLMEGNSDIVDLILLSKSKVIVASATSTFSYWAGFLSEAVLIMHPDHLHKSIRPADLNNIWYEGSLLNDRQNPILVKNLRGIAYEQT